MKRRRLLAGAALPLLAACAHRPSAGRPAGAWPYATLDGEPPLVIAHRGASGERPEHTLAAYALAIDQGADYIEPDLVSTRDGVLVARHDAELSLTTDVAQHATFAARRRTQTIDGTSMTGWFVEDFSWDELQQLRARERWPQWRPQSATFDGQFGVPSLQQVIELLQAEQRRHGRPIGLYPETKHPRHYAARGLALEGRLIEALHGAGWRTAAAPVLLQSFDPESLRALAGLSALRRVQLAGERVSLDEAALRNIAQYAQAIGVAKAQVIGRDAQARLGAPTSLVARAHAVGLAVHAWTFRREANFLPTEMQPDEELRRFLATGLDGVFADQPGAARAVVQSLMADRGAR
jgi:glycerophosphoryl diester phosphodiesterase